MFIRVSSSWVHRYACIMIILRSSKQARRLIISFVCLLSLCCVSLELAVTFVSICTNQTQQTDREQACPIDCVLRTYSAPCLLAVFGCHGKQHHGNAITNARSPWNKWIWMLTDSKCWFESVKSAYSPWKRWTSRRWLYSLLFYFHDDDDALLLVPDINWVSVIFPGWCSCRGLVPPPITNA